MADKVEPIKDPNEIMESQLARESNPPKAYWPLDERAELVELLTSQEPKFVAVAKSDATNVYDSNVTLLQMKRTICVAGKTKNQVVTLFSSQGGLITFNFDAARHLPELLKYQA